MAANSECAVFGSGEIFAEFESVPDTEPVKKKSRKNLDKKITRLVAENEQLKDKMRMLIQPKGIRVEDDKHDGPIAQVMYMNHSIVRRYRQEIEDFFESLARKTIGEDHQREFNEPQPQWSSVELFKEANAEKKMAFTAVGNVQYYHHFCIDKIGKPLFNGNPRLTVGWCIPEYEQTFSESLPEDDQPSGRKRQKACCFNCGEDDHGVRDCPQPQDLARISANKRKFMMSMPNIPTSKRYHLDEVNIEKFKTGHLSDELRSALGLKPSQLPLHTYQMRVYGYPPGHLKEAEVVKSGLTVYDNNEEGESVGVRQKEDQPSYDHEKLIRYPGFNVDIPHHMHDECERFRMPPIQPDQHLKAFTRHLPTSTEHKYTSKKRTNFSDDDVVEEVKRRKMENRQEENMDISITDSDTERTSLTVGSSPSGDDTFKPPLPLTPGYATPPPLPTSTPPPTPGRTPKSGPCSPQIQDTSTPVMSRTPSCGSLDSEANNIGSFSPYSATTSQEGSRTQSPSLDDLEQQRLNLLSAFEDGDTEGTSDTGETININGELFAVTDVEGESENESNTVQSANQNEDSQSGDIDSTNQTPSSFEDGSDEVQVPLKDPGYSSERTENDGDAEGRNEETTMIPEQDDLTPNKSGVPHWSKFSKDISPHPPHENLMESTGVFKRLCGILKKKKK